MSWVSPIVRINSGYLNNTNDTYPGGGTAANKFGGQLGAIYEASPAQAAQLSKSSVGTLYAGRYQYVQLKAGATVPARGAFVFWDSANDADGNTFAVTQVESGTTLTAAALAGVWLNSTYPEAGKYGWIQIAGIATVKYVASITGTKAIGRPGFISVAGTTSIGLVDIVDDLTTTAGARFFNRWLGWAIDLPADGELGKFQLAANLSPRAA